MSCEDCEQQGRLRRAVANQLQAAASAHGYTLWTRADARVELELLAIPSGPSHGSPEALMAAFQEVRRGAPRPPRAPGSKPPRQRQRPTRTKHPRDADDGMTTYRLEGTAPPILLTFIDKLG